MLTAAYLCNRMPQSGLDVETLFKWLYVKEANLSHLKMIGARAFVHIKNAKKLEPKSWEGMLCGFNEDEALPYRIWESFNDWGGRGCRKFVPVSKEDGTKIAPPGDIFDQPPGEMS